MVDRQERDADRARLQEAQINRALGLFLLCFAAIVFVAVFFTETGVGKATNLVASLILGAIGAVMVVRSGSGPGVS